MKMGINLYRSLSASGTYSQIETLGANVTTYSNTDLIRTHNIVIRLKHIMGQVIRVIHHMIVLLTFLEII